MSQFMLVERGIDALSLDAVRQDPVDPGDEFLREVAVEYFGDWVGPRVITDKAGSGESLIDDVCGAQAVRSAIEETTCLRLLRHLVESRIPFVVWYGGDYSNLPVARSWSEVLEMVRVQTSMQPADLYLRFTPGSLDVVTCVRVVGRARSSGPARPECPGHNGGGVMKHELRRFSLVR